MMKILLGCTFKARPTLMQHFYETTLNGTHLNQFETRLITFSKSFLYEFTPNSYCHLDYNRTKCKLRQKSQIVMFQLFLLTKCLEFLFTPKKWSTQQQSIFQWDRFLDLQSPSLHSKAKKRSDFRGGVVSIGLFWFFLLHWNLLDITNRKLYSNVRKRTKMREK